MSSSDGSSPKQSSGTVSNATFYACILGAFCAPAGAFALYFYRFGDALSGEQDVWGQFGDYLAGVSNPVLGLITVGLLVLTLRTQQIELQDQRKELAKSAEALNDQNRAIGIQGFEQTFFSWLKTYRDLYSSMQTGPGEGSNILRGSDFVGYLLAKTNDMHRLRMHLIAAEQLDRCKVIELSTSAWESVYATYGATLGTPLRTLFTLVKWVDKHALLDQSQKWDYMTILRSQLSNTELKLLFHNGYHEGVGQPFVHYVDKYALLNNLHKEPSSTVNHLIKLTAHPYAESAFNSQAARERLGLPEMI